MFLTAYNLRDNILSVQQSELQDVNNTEVKS